MQILHNREPQTPQEWFDTQTIKKIQSTVLNAEPRCMIIKTDLYQCSGPKMGAKINLINPNIDQMQLKKKKLYFGVLALNTTKNWIISMDGQI